MKADAGELIASGEACEVWSWFCGGLVVFGLVAAVALAILHPPYDSFWERWGVALSDTLIAAGVAGEILFARMASKRQGELLRQSNEQLAEAWSMADKAGDKARDAEELARNALGIPRFDPYD